MAVVIASVLTQVERIDEGLLELDRVGHHGVSSLASSARCSRAW